MDKYVSEFLGTFFLVLTIALTGNPLAIGSIIMAMVYMAGPISGGHFNPAVTMGVFMRGKIELRDSVIYCIFQIMGALIAAIVSMWLLGKTFAPTIAPDVPILKVLVAEFVFTFALVSVVLNVATTEKSKGNSYFGLAIGFTVMVGGLAVGSISGGVFNPAVAIGPAVLDAVYSGSAIQYLPIYLVGTLMGAFVAGWVFKVMNPNEQAQALSRSYAANATSQASKL